MSRQDVTWRCCSSIPLVSHQTIVVLDFGSQYTQLIARRLRELSVYSEVVPFNMPLETLRAKAPSGIILSGGPLSVSDPDAPRCDPLVFELGSPVLGICYGMQLMTDIMGGNVRRSGHREFGHALVHITGKTSEGFRLFSQVPSELRVWASHGDDVASVPPGFSVTATGATVPVAAMADPDGRSMGCCFTRKLSTQNTGQRFFATSRMGCAGALAIGRLRHLSTRRQPASARRSEREEWSAGCPAESTRPWPHCSCTARSAID